jgi:hypothetical protein
MQRADRVEERRQRVGDVVLEQPEVFVEEVRSFFRPLR